jgi:hypothetical protein
MNYKRIADIFAISLSCILLLSCKGTSPNNLLIITRVPGNFQNQDFVTGESWRYVPGARIAVLNPEKPGSVKVLSDKFYSASCPEISYDGERILFAAQQKEGDLWQIFEMEIKNLKTSKITSLKENCFDPVYLPSGRVAFTGYIDNDTVKSAYCLFSCNPDGSDTRQLTFGPFSSYATAVLKDGRLLTINRQLLPDKRDPMLMVLRPDGTKADMFYKGPDGSKIISRGRETADGKILFIETKNGNTPEGNLISVSYNRPLHTRIDLTSEIGGSFNSVLSLQSGNLLVSWRKSDSDHYSLYEFDMAEKAPGKILYDDPEYNVLDVIEAVKYERPKKLPSEVDYQVKTGLLLCQDINYMEFLPAGKDPGIKASRIEITGIDSTYGAVKVEEDGSFYLKVMADIPFQIRTLDDKGNVLNGPSSWLWLRPNERRGCVGCHENPEIVPKNRVSFAVKKAPVIIPVHKTEVREKVVELE